MKYLLNSKLELNRIKIFTSILKINSSDLNNNSHSWSVAQHLYHCWLVECLTENYIRKKILNPKFIGNVSAITYIRSFFLQLFFKLGYKAKAPKPTAIFPDHIDINKLKLDWDNSRKSLDNLIIILHEMKLEKKGFFNHPAIGRLNLWLVLNFLEFHLIHHIKQIDKLITNIN
jgi:hypothetical protein|tara:strand:- start:393 stop:911 length:519 start_codon:yes stop_codon:yes gene_type:complete